MGQITRSMMLHAMSGERNVLPDNPTHAEMEEFITLTLAAPLRAGGQRPQDPAAERVRLYQIALRFIASQTSQDLAVESDEPVAAAVLAALRAEFPGVEVPWKLIYLANDVARAAFNHHAYALRRARERADAESSRHSDEVL